MGPQADTNDVDWGLWHTQHLERVFTVSYICVTAAPGLTRITLCPEASEAEGLGHDTPATRALGKSAESHPVNHLPSPWAPHLDNPLTFPLVSNVCEAWPWPFPLEDLEESAIGTSDVTCSGMFYRGASGRLREVQKPAQGQHCKRLGWDLNRRPTDYWVALLPPKAPSHMSLPSFWPLAPP